MNKKLKIISVVGARPNFMKIAPFMKAIKRYNENKLDKIENILVHTGQHYDEKMSKTFFQELNIPQADINLGTGSGTHAEQVGYTIIAFEKVLQKEKPDWVIVTGDVNATLACSITAKKLNIKVCHIEAGLRSFDMTMPEEINRIVTDHLSDLLLTPDKISTQNLLNEGIDRNKIVMVGNIMIDTLEENINSVNSLNVMEIIKNNLISNQSVSLKTEDNFALLTLHRPSNVDKREVLSKLTEFFINKISTKLPLVWIIHPRTAKQLKEFKLWNNLIKQKNIALLNPIGYKELLKLNMTTKLLLTDSGGLQEEATILGTPCITLRYNTERPITLLENHGVSVLTGNDTTKILDAFSEFLNKKRKPVRPELWDGKTAERCLTSIISFS